MYCSQCRTLILEGDRCSQCGQLPPVFQPPPTTFDKKGDLEEICLSYRQGKSSAGELTEYLRSERAKAVDARARLAAPPVDESGSLPLSLAIDFWEQTLQFAQRWLEGGGETDYQNAIAMAAQTDSQLKRAVMYDWSLSREAWSAQQEALRLQDSMGDFKFRDWPK